MAVEVDALSCIVVSPVEYVMSMVVPYHDGLAFWNFKILALLMILVCYDMLMSLVEMSIDSLRRDTESQSDFACEFMHLLHGGRLGDDSHALTDRFCILWQLLRLRRVRFPDWHHLLKSCCWVNNRVTSLFVKSWYCQLFSVLTKLRFTAEMLRRIAFLSLTNLISHRLEVRKLPRLIEV